MTQKMQCYRRLTRDLKRLMADSQRLYSATPVNDDMQTWKAVVLGPPGSPWEGGIFRLSLTFPDQYPQVAPKVKFLSRLFHPNVYKSGDICADFLEANWSPTYDVLGVLTSLQSLLTDPNCNSPANLEAAKLCQSSPDRFAQEVLACVEQSVDEAEYSEDDDDE